MDGIGNVEDEIRDSADEIIKEFPQLSEAIKDAWKTMYRCIEEGESKVEEQDLFYWYIHKLKKGVQHD